MASRRRTSRLRYPIAMYDRLYRWLHDLDRPEARFGPVVCLKIARSRRDVCLDDGCMVRRGEPIGVIHLNNERIAALHAATPLPGAVGFLFRSQFVASLRELAAHADQAGSLAHVRAFTATTIIHH